MSKIKSQVFTFLRITLGDNGRNSVENQDSTQVVALAQLFNELAESAKS